MTTGPHTLTAHAVEGTAMLRAVIATKEHTQQLLLASATLHRAHAPAASVSCPSVPHLVLGQSGKAAPSSFCTDLTTTGTAVGTTEQCWCLLEVTAASGRDESHRAATTATEAWLELFKNPNAVTTNTIQCFNYFPLWSQLGPISNDLQLHSSKQSSDYFRLF